jgi:23S rRNA (cytidine1920-2'-O)/16S rRNA (cytidine1409-2'-O)-methyltransferase
VSRGGVKLAYALDQLSFEIENHVCLDVGASTGGFTDVLIARGARRVYAVDVGRDQLHASLRGHAAIVSLEDTDIRALDPALITDPPDIVVIDVSFISLKHILPSALALAAARTHILALVKPQFETMNRRHRKKGIVRDHGIHAAVCADISGYMTSIGCQIVTTFPSPIAGGDGNREFFIGAVRD